MPQLVARGHHVIAATRTPAKVDALRAAGAEPAVFDALDREAVRKAVASAKPEVVVHQMTALAKVRNFKEFDKEFTLTNRLRTEATEYLLAAVRTAGAGRFIAQSYTGWPNERTGGRVKTEQDPLDPNPPKAMSQSLKAIRLLEAMVSGASDVTGIVLRYGSFYGPGTSLGTSGEIVELVRKRKFPIIGSGAGVWSFIHIDDASSATRIAIEGGPRRIYNIVEDESADVSVWLPDLARAVGAKPPRHLPAWLGRLVIGETGVSIMTSVRGSSNLKTKQILDWQPVYATWRDGFRRGLAAELTNITCAKAV